MNTVARPYGWKVADFKNRGASALQAVGQSLRLKLSKGVCEVALKSKPGVIVGKRDAEILKDVGFYRYMTALDVCLLLYSRSSLTHVRAILTRLAGGGDFVENEFLYRLPLDRGGGNRARVYTLGARGRDFLRRELGLPASWYFRPGKTRSVSVGQMMHNLCLTRFLVAARLWCGKGDNWRVSRVHTCYEAGADYPRVEMTKEGRRETLAVIPDAWILFEKRVGEERVFFPVLLEVDRGTAYRVKFKEHVAARVEFIKKGGVYGRLFGREEVLVCYVTTGETEELREARRRSMCQWAMEVLGESGRESWASVFRFCSVCFEEMYWLHVFEECRWYVPGEETPVGLFEG